MNDEKLQYLVHTKDIWLEVCGQRLSLFPLSSPALSREPPCISLQQKGRLPHRVLILHRLLTLSRTLLPSPRWPACCLTGPTASLHEHSSSSISPENDQKTKAVRTERDKRISFNFFVDVVRMWGTITGTTKRKICCSEYYAERQILFYRNPKADVSVVCKDYNIFDCILLQNILSCKMYTLNVICYKCVDCMHMLSRL